MTARLEVRELHVSYGGTSVVHGIDLTIDEGEVVALLGANGAGKTSTLRAISRHGVVSRGTIRLDGIDIERLGDAAAARAGIGHVPEGRGTFNELSVKDNLRVGAIARKDTAAVKRDIAKFFDVFPKLSARADQPAGTLSGGEQQMLAICRALMGRPRLLLLDEPSFGVAPRVTQEIYGLLAGLRKEGLTALVVEQSAELVLRLAQRAYVLECGAVAASGPSNTLLQDDTIRRSYLGA
jgi:branched-chain amino acid transport system ATP-binding protein